MQFPTKLQHGDTVRVLALSRSLGAFRIWQGHTDGDVARAQGRLEELGLVVTYGEHVEECDADGLVPIEARLEDFHAAFRDESVRAVVAVTGGIGAIQMLDRIDYDLVARCPKFVVGYSDIGYLHLALFARSGLVGYYGPNFAGFAAREGLDYTLDHFQRCLFQSQPFDVRPSAQWSDDGKTFHPNDGYWSIADGVAEGTVLGGNSFCLGMLKGTAYAPDLSGAILFVESTGHGRASLMALDSDLRALGLARDFKPPAGLVIGRYAATARIDSDALRRIVAAIPWLAGIPILAHADFGHTTPRFTLPIGGRCRLEVAPDRQRLAFLTH